MASTNKTSNYELSQFVGSDKPAWLGDYNSDMSKIDTAIKNASDTATSASGSASSATTAIGDISTLTTTDKTSLVGAVNEVNTTAGTAQTTANSAYGLANSASTNITNLATYLTMSQFTTPTATGSNNINITTSDVSCASNSTGSLGKIYGRIYFTASSTGTASISFATPLRPTTAITINGGGQLAWGTGDPNVDSVLTYTLGTDGTCTISASVTGGNRYRAFLWNSLIFATDFGDVPTPE